MSKIMLSLTSAAGNNNKFYEIVTEGDAVQVRYGRVGANGQRKTYTGGKSKAEQLKQAKIRKGYTVVDIADGTEAASPNRSALRAGVLAGQDDPAMADVVDYLIDKNQHDIATASGGHITVRDGAVQTPLGPLRRSAIADGRDLLARLEQTYPPLNVPILEEYLRRVPQKVGSKRGWEDEFLSGPEDFAAQRTFLDQLEAGLDTEAVTGTDAVPFRHTLTLCTTPGIVADMQREYDATANRNHGSVARAKVKAVYEVSDTEDADGSAFETTAKRLGNVKMYWHGTRAANLLSIMAAGFRLPRASDHHTAGAMFGHGLYFSEQSSKSANYARGGVWSTGHDPRWFMLRADVVMGNAYRAGRDYRGSSYYDGILRGTRYDSIDVPAGRGNVRNHEAIVPGPDRVKVRYVVEFSG